jgi:UDPglucose 6-dehydrogenase
VSRIFIVGSGVVGAATGRAFVSAAHRVTFIDIARPRIAALCAEGLDARSVLDLDGEPESFIFVCLPTPNDGQAYDLSALEAGVEAVGRALSTADARHIVVVRSTVPPGTTEELVRQLIERESGKREGLGFSLAVCPEFLRSTSADHDACRPRITVIGARSEQICQRLRHLLGELGGNFRVFDNPATAELIKCTHSLFNATKISFWNEIWQLCDRLGIDQDAVAGAVAQSAQGSFNRDYGIHGGAPYGGGHLPRDTRGFLGFAAGLGLPMPLLTAVVGVNDALELRMSAELDGVSGLAAIPRGRHQLPGPADGNGAGNGNGNGNGDSRGAGSGPSRPQGFRIPRQYGH